jgi:hypothetical protein
MRWVFFSILYLIMRGLLRLAGSDADLRDQEGRDPRPPPSGEGAVEAFRNHPTLRCDARALDLRAARPGRGLSAVRPRGRRARGPVPAAAEMLAEDGPRHLVLHRVPVRALEVDLVQQPRGAPEEGDPTSHPTSSGSSPIGTRPSDPVGPVRAEQDDEWQVVRGYMSPDSLAKARIEVIDGDAVEQVRGELVAAS